MANIFLKEFKHKKSVNTSEGLNISLKGKRKLLPTSDVSEVISQYDVYTEERKRCNIIRLTCQVNVVCSNVLCNSITEVVANEGSSGMSFLNYKIINGKQASNEDEIASKIYCKPNKVQNWTVTEAVRDMQLSNFGYVYHCGYDIFNNHLIRSNTFKSVCESKDNKDNNMKFNTIMDMLRNEDGSQVKDRVYYPLSSGYVNKGKTPISINLYKYDDLYTYKKCVEERLIKSFDGWIGFYNTSKIKTYLNYGSDDQEPMGIDKPIMYLNGGDFVDMYPDRSLYSFVPKYNTFKNRVEKNWNYCLTYPSLSYTPSKPSDPFTDIIEYNDGINSLKAIYFNENTISDNGSRQLVIYSITKHGLSVGDYVNIYKTDSNSATTLVLNNVKVIDVADEFIFTVFSTVQLSKYWVELTNVNDDGEIILHLEDSPSSGTTFLFYQKKYFVKKDNGTVDLDKKYYIINGTNYVNFDKNAQNISFKKVVNGIECDYYVRIFSKIPNFKFSSADTSSEYEIYKNDGELISEYQQKKYDFESHVSKLAFANNIYSDSIGEVVFTDDIDISNLKDNLGRPVSSIYLTVVKNNAGYKEWYGFDTEKSYNWSTNDILSDNVEFSHCFGAITCGIQTSEESKFNNDIKSINKITPIIVNANNTNSSLSDSPGFNVDVINGDRDEGTVKNYTIDSTEIWFNLDKNYFGDLCYYDNYNAVERVIQPILHRFNTAQRECIGSESNEMYNSFIYDDIKSDSYDVKGFEVKETEVKGCNSKKEGYYYNPHYEIKIKSFDKVETAMPDFLTIIKVNAYEDSVRFTSLENHYLSLGDKTVVYDKINKKYYNCETINGFNDNTKVYTCRMYDENGNLAYPINIFKNLDYTNRPLSDFKVFKLDNLDIPSYARILKDGTCRVIWRNVLNNGFNMSDDSVEEYPFTNGAFYVNKSINLYVRRQDPYGIWGLYSSDDIPGADINIDEEDNYVKDIDIEC